MPIEILYIVGLLAVICLTFLVLKRPIYECMFYGYVTMLLCTGRITDFFTFIGDTSKDTLFYAIIAFLVLAKILDMTIANALKIDFEKEPPFFKLSDTHYAATWALHPKAPELPMPEVLRNRIAREKEAADV